MALKTADLKTELIDAVCARVRERLPAEQAPSCEAFVRQYYHWLPPEDSAARSPLDLYGAAIAHWNLAQRRAPREAKVRVYNPDYEQHGWRCPQYTVVEVVTSDMPYLVDSVTMELTRQGYLIDLVIHPVMQICRDADGQLLEVTIAEAGAPHTNGGPAASTSASAESVLHVEVGREPDQELLAQLRAGLMRVLGDVRAAVEDWEPMRRRSQALIEELESQPPPIAAEEVEEVKAFLRWLVDDHFTFLGYREYDFLGEEDPPGLRAIADSGLGILRGDPVTPYTKLNAKALALARALHPLVLTEANSSSTVHRPASLDYIGVKKFGPDGQVIGERRFLGLYTTAADKAPPGEIPFLRDKVQAVVDRAGFTPHSHDAKALVEILETYPRNALFQIQVDELFDVAMGILELGERQRVKLFVRPDPLDRFMSCLVCIPRDRFNTENRELVGRILMEALGGKHLDWTLQLTESLLARVHYVVHCAHGVPAEFDVAAIEARLVQATRAWTDDLRDELLQEHGEDGGAKLYTQYEHAFPPAYRADWDARAAVADIEKIKQLTRADEPIISLYRPLEAPSGMIRCKLFSSGGVSLSDVLPTFEHMGAHVIDERPYEISPSDRPPVWLYDFRLRCLSRRPRERAEQLPDGLP